VSEKIGPREYMGATGLRSDWVARQMGVHYSYLSHLLAGRRPWTPRLRQRFAVAVGMAESAINFAQILVPPADGPCDDGNVASVAAMAPSAAQDRVSESHMGPSTGEPGGGPCDA